LVLFGDAEAAMLTGFEELHPIPIKVARAIKLKAIGKRIR
jgi:hypothetical protein